MLKRIVLAVGVGALGLVGCGGTSGTDGGTGGGGGAASTFDAGSAVGGFTVTLAEGFATIDGKVTDAPTPPLVQWETKASAGDCTLIVPRQIHCDPSCGGTAVCVATNSCMPYPSGVSVGQVTVTGVHTAGGQATFDLSATNKFYYFYTPELAFPPFAENEVVTVSAAGGASGAFVLEARGVAPLALTSHDHLISAASSLTLTWAAAQAGNSRVSVLVDLTHHGGTKAQIVCDTADDGSIEVPQSLVSSLMAYGATGYPWIVLTRRSSDTAAMGSREVRLDVASLVSEVVSVPGVTSCTESTDCDGGTCKLPERVCQ